MPTARYCRHCGQPVHDAPDHLRLPPGTLVHADGAREWCRDGKHRAEAEADLLTELARSFGIDLDARHPPPDVIGGHWWPEAERG